MSHHGRDREASLLKTVGVSFDEVAIMEHLRSRLHDTSYNYFANFWPIWPNFSICIYRNFSLGFEGLVFVQIYEREALS